MAHLKNPRHVAIGVETVCEDVRTVVSSHNSIDIHVRDPSSLNDVLTAVREMSENNSNPEVWPHKQGDGIAVRLWKGI